MTKKDILIIVGTHGDELIGSEIIKLLQKSGDSHNFDVLVANQAALDKKVRFLEVDLNRVYPGKEDGQLEERLAFMNLDVARQYKFVIDIHETKSPKNFIIIPKPHLGQLKKFINYISIRDIVFWPSTSGRPTGPMAQFLDHCLELEFSTNNGRDRASNIKSATKIISGLIKNYKNDKKLVTPKNYYFVYDKLLINKTGNNDVQLKDFTKTKLAGEIFYPLLSGRYLRNEITCYKMKRGTQP